MKTTFASMHSLTFFQPTATISGALDREKDMWNILEIFNEDCNLYQHLLTLRNKTKTMLIPIASVCY